MTSSEAVRLFDTAGRLPFDDFDRFREQGNVVWDRDIGGWLVIGYAECREVFLNEALFAHNYSRIDADTLEIKGGRNLVTMQGGKHDRMHRYAGPFARQYSPICRTARRPGHRGAVCNDTGGKVRGIAQPALQPGAGPFDDVDDGHAARRRDDGPAARHAA